MRAVKKTMAAVAVAVSMYVAAASAEELTAARSRAIIERQFNAFALDDAEAAYALADPTIKHMFGDAGHFMTMVREHYARSTGTAASSLAPLRNQATRRASRQPSSTVTMSYGPRSTV
jgi:hypothetical protein